jgi:hypothetical protein
MAKVDEEKNKRLEGKKDLDFTEGESKEKIKKVN